MSEKYVICPFVMLVVSHFGSEGGTVDLIAPVPGSCLPLILSKI